MDKTAFNCLGSTIPQIQVIGITGIPEILTGDQLGPIILKAAESQGTTIEDRDILVVTQKIVSKAEGRIVSLNDITPSRMACELGCDTGKDPRLVELILKESRSLVRIDRDRGIIISETNHGFICANAGIDASNVPGGDSVSLLPEYPDRSANEIRTQIEAYVGNMEISVIISDTFGRAWREGHVNFAIGLSGINPLKDYKGTTDTQGQSLNVTNIAIADELASTAELVTGKALNIPVAIVRGYEYAKLENGDISVILRDEIKDLFR